MSSNDSLKAKKGTINAIKCFNRAPDRRLSNALKEQGGELQRLDKASSDELGNALDELKEDDERFVGCLSACFQKGWYGDALGSHPRSC